MAEGRRALMQTLIDALEQGDAVAEVTIVQAPADLQRLIGAKLLAWPDGRTVGSLGDGPWESAAVEEALRSFSQMPRQPRTLWLRPSGELLQHRPAASSPHFEVYREVHEGEPTLLIVGAGHIGSALHRLAKPLGFRIMVVDDRAAFANRERFPDADEVIAADFTEGLSSVRITGATYVVVVTRGHKQDYDSLRQVAASPAAYIGMIGSRRRVRAVIEALEREGIPATALERIYAPIGLDIGAETPEEIAISILAEIVKVRHGGKAQSLAVRERRRAGVLAETGGR